MGNVLRNAWVVGVFGLVALVACTGELGDTGEQPAAHIAGASAEPDVAASPETGGVAMTPSVGEAWFAVEGACSALTTSNAAHVAAGRAYVRTTRIVFFTLSRYYATGSDENLGYSGSQTTSLYEVAPGRFSTQATCQPFCGDRSCDSSEDCDSCAEDCGACQPECGDGTCNGLEDCSSCAEDCGACQSFCGDGTCNGNEDCASCAADCGACAPYCGDGACDVDEDCNACAADCGACPAACGDGSCDPEEDCGTCADDCGVCGPTCGDGSCNGNETCRTCADDCGACPAVCGDGSCGGSESCETCEADCGACGGSAMCGDGQCNGAEECSSCEADCGACAPVCGDGSCNGDEDCGSCAADCGACAPVCGDGTCNGNETCSTCASDCGRCAPVCGDGSCNGNETCSGCSTDCGTCPSTGPDCRNASSWPAAWVTFEQDVLRLTNEARARGADCGGTYYGPVGPLTMNAELREAARCHSMDMGELNYFSHTSLDGRSPWDRIDDAGYNGPGPLGENIAAGYRTAASVVQGWLDSPGHCVNVMNGRFGTIGIGYGYVDPSTYRHYWSQNFGGR